MSTPARSAMESLEPRRLLSSARLAVIGDFGSDNAPEASVANLVKEWETAAPLDGVLTVGDNNYSYGEWSTIDTNIGKYYSQFIGSYVGSYGPGSPVNRFFPAAGNHDWDSTVDHDGDGLVGLDPQNDYFTLPGNERYYDVVLGPVHVFVVDSDPREPDGRSASSVQAQWLRNAMGASTAPWQVVVFHHPAYSSASHGSTTEMRWPFAAWGADLVLSGHDHSYERLQADGIPYIVNGLGGRSLYTFGTPLPESQLRYNADYGAQLMEATDNELKITLCNSGYAQARRVVDSITLTKTPAPPPSYSTLSFQQGASGYAGAVDTGLRQADPNTGYGTAATLTVDGDDPASTGNDAQALLRFDGLFGSAAGQVPAGSEIVSAWLELSITNAGNTVQLHRMNAPWSGSSTWAGFGNGIQADGIEALAAADASFTPGSLSTHAIDVTASLRAWAANPQANLGWALLPTGSDGADFTTSEGSIRPRLVVNFNPPATPLPLVSITATDAAAAEAGLNPGLFTVTRTGNLSGDLLVYYSAGGTATAGSDYQSLSGTVLIPAGSASATFSVVPINDSGYEPNESVIVVLLDRAEYDLGTPASATVTIASDDPQPAVPAAPTQLSGKAAKGGVINLSWADNSTNETRFIIEWSLDGQNWSVLGTVGANVTSYSVSGLSASTTYYFRVRAANDFGSSTYSNVLKIRTGGKGR